MVERVDETHQTILRGTGETHLAVAAERLARKFGVEVATEDVLVPFRETISQQAEAEGKYKKQTGGHGQFGVASIRIEPLERGEGFHFVDQVVGGAIPKQYIPAVEKGVLEAMSQGGVLRLPRRRRAGDVLRRQVPLRRLVGDELQDGGVAGVPGGHGQSGPGAARAHLAARGDRPGQHAGRHPRRSQLPSGPRPGDRLGRRRPADRSPPSCPTAEIQRYAVDLRSLTGGRGRFRADHDHYDAMPSNLVERMAKAKSNGS